MSKKIIDIKDAEKKMSTEERARRAAHRIAKKYKQNTNQEPDQAAAGKTTNNGGMDYDGSEE